MTEIKIKEAHRNDGSYGKFLTGREDEKNRRVFLREKGGMVLITLHNIGKMNT